jgi:hypothetical protein
VDYFNGTRSAVQEVVDVAGEANQVKLTRAHQMLKNTMR